MEQARKANSAHRHGGIGALNISRGGGALKGDSSAGAGPVSVAYVGVSINGGVAGDFPRHSANYLLADIILCKLSSWR